MTSNGVFSGLRQQGRLRLRVVAAPLGATADALLVAWVGRRPAGVAGIRRRGDVAVVGPVTLRPFARRFGIEAALDAFGADVARRAGARTVIGTGADRRDLRRAG
jgi:hypothetical protein